MEHSRRVDRGSDWPAVVVVQEAEVGANFGKMSAMESGCKYLTKGLKTDASHYVRGMTHKQLIYNPMNQHRLRLLRRGFEEKRGMLAEMAEKTSC